MEGMLRAFAGMLGISPDEIKNGARDVIQSVQNVDARLARIERALGIADAQVVQHPATQNASQDKRG